MLSQLEAALLRHGSDTIQATVDDDREEQDELVEDEYIDEECEGDAGQRSGRHYTNNVACSKTVTLQMLLAADILQPGDGTMSIEYMGQTFIGDLLEDGKIRSQETDLVFASPSAWAIACKRFINPVRKSGCGWSSVRYKGRKLDAYKIIWYKRKKDELSNLLREELEV